MPLPSPDTTPDSTDPEDELDDPYIHTVSTEEFVEAVEAAGHQKDQTLSSSGQDNDLPESEKRA